MIFLGLTLACGGSDEKPSVEKQITNANQEQQAQEVEEEKPSEAEVSAKLCKRMEADIASYYEKEQTVIGVLEPDSYYNYKYDGAEKTHYSFDFECGETDLQVYGEKNKFKDLFNYALDGYDGKVTVKLTILTDETHEDTEIFTLLKWEMVKEE